MEWLQTEWCIVRFMNIVDVTKTLTVLAQIPET